MKRDWVIEAKKRKEIFSIYKKSHVGFVQERTLTGRNNVHHKIAIEQLVIISPFFVLGKTYAYHGLNYRNVANDNDVEQHCVRYNKELWLNTERCETRNDIFFFSTTGALYWNDFALCLNNKNDNDLKIEGSQPCQGYVVSDTVWITEKPHKKELIFKSTATSKYFKRSTDGRKLKFDSSSEKGWSFHNADPSANCKYSFLSYRTILHIKYSCNKEKENYSVVMFFIMDLTLLRVDQNCIVVFLKAISSS